MTLARCTLLLLLLAGCATEPAPTTPPDGLSRQSREMAEAKSAGCLSWHVLAKDKSGPGLFDDPNMHVAEARVGCTDCHGGNAGAYRPDESPNLRPYDNKYLATMKDAHIQPRLPEEWTSSAN